MTRLTLRPSARRRVRWEPERVMAAGFGELSRTRDTIALTVSDTRLAVWGSLRLLKRRASWPNRSLLNLKAIAVDAALERWGVGQSDAQVLYHVWLP